VSSGPDETLAALPLALDWSAYDAYGAGDAYAALPRHGAGFGKAAAVCIGSRTCQRSDAKGVMCPSFRATGDAEHSTRHRAATLKAALDGELGDSPFTHPQLQAALDLCLACKGCKRECPNGVDMALLKTEALAQRWRREAAPLRERFFAATPTWLHALRRWPGAHRLPALRRPGSWLARWLERRFGLAVARSTPALAPRSWLETARPMSSKAAGEPAAAPAREVLLLVDTFSNHFDPETLDAAMGVLQAAGCRVHIARPPAGDGAHPADPVPLCCGRTALSGGFVDAAREHARRLLAVLGPHVAAGHAVIGLEPSCLLMLRDEYLALGLGPELQATAQAVAAQAWLLEEFLAREVQPAPIGAGPASPSAPAANGKARLTLPLGPLPAAPGATPPSALVHGHCHQKAYGALKPMRKVLGWVPGLKTEFIESSCCGMAGSFGLEAEHHALSMQMAELALLPAVRAAADETWLLANGSSCRHQIRDGAQREARHFVHLLWASVQAASR